jgi:biotin transport system substrate-specific component
LTTLALAVSPARVRSNVAYRVALAFAGSWLVAGLAQVEVRLPFTPVPITGQTLGVLLAGAALGPGLGTLSMGLYLLQGAIGLPFFAGADSGVGILQFASARGGYLWGFVAAGAIVGWLARRGWDRDVRSAISAMFVGEVVLYLVAIPWLMQAIDVPLGKALELGLAPFVIGDAVKVGLAAGLLPSAWRLIRRGGHGNGRK